MSGQVFRIDGDQILALPGVANEVLIDFIEELLQLAKDGEICGVVVASMFPATHGYLRAATNNHAGYTDSYAMVGALEEAKFQMLRRLSET